MAVTESTPNVVPATPGPASSPAPAQPPMGGITGNFTWTAEVDRRRGLIGLIMMHGDYAAAHLGTSLWLAPDDAEKAGNAMLTAVAAWRGAQ
jgi:hypothetical protein